MISRLNKYNANLNLYEHIISQWSKILIAILDIFYGLIYLNKGNK